MTETAFIDIITAGGPSTVLAILAFVILQMHKKGEDMARQDRVFMEDRMTNLLEQDQTTREEHTRVLTELITWLKAKNGSR